MHALKYTHVMLQEQYPHIWQVISDLGLSVRDAIEYRPNPDVR